MIPEFLYAENNQEMPGKIFVFHTSFPKFMVAFDKRSISTISSLQWLDVPPFNKEESQRLIDQACRFLREEYKHKQKEVLVA